MSEDRDRIDELANQRVEPGRAGGGFISQLRRLGFANLIPFGTWSRDKPWNLLLVRWFLVLSLAPLVLTTLAYTVNPVFQSIAFAFAIYFALMWGLVIYLFVRPERIGFGDVVRVAGFTILAGVALLGFYQQIPWVQSLYRAAQGTTVPSRLFGFIVGVGLAEETVKILPILWIFLRNREPGTLREITFLGCVSGFAFGAAEAVLYSMAYVLNLQIGQLAFEQFIVVQYARLITIPLLHAMFSGIAGYFVGLAVHHSGLRRGLVVAAIGIPAVLHGVYNTFSTGPVGLIAAVAAILMFISYVRNVDSMQLALAEAERTGSETPDRDPEDG